MNINNQYQNSNILNFRKGKKQYKKYINKQERKKGGGWIKINYMNAKQKRESKKEKYWLKEKVDENRCTNIQKKEQKKEKNQENNQSILKNEYKTQLLYFYIFIHKFYKNQFLLNQKHQYHLFLSCCADTNAAWPKEY
ncbi:hypothetical protein ABPG74_017119 [Tetrahymena malaccensis]